MRHAVVRRAAFLYRGVGRIRLGGTPSLFRAGYSQGHGMTRTSYEIGLHPSYDSREREGNEEVHDRTVHRPLRLLHCATW